MVIGFSNQFHLISPSMLTAAQHGIHECWNSLSPIPLIPHIVPSHTNTTNTTLYQVPSHTNTTNTTYYQVTPIQLLHIVPSHTNTTKTTLYLGTKFNQYHIVPVGTKSDQQISCLILQISISYDILPITRKYFHTAMMFHI